MIKDTLKVLSPHKENKISRMLFQNILRTEKSVSLYINVLYQIIKNFPRNFSNLFTQKECLVKTEDTIYLAAADKIFGENFKLTKK